MRDKRDTYTNDGGGYSKPRVTQNKKRADAVRGAVTGALGSYVMSSANKAWVDRLTPTYQTEKSLASRPQTDQINSRRYRAKVTQNVRQYTPEIDSKRTRTYWKSSNGDSGVKRTPVRRKGRWTEE